jgi:hypothetical protein
MALALHNMNDTNGVLPLLEGQYPNGGTRYQPDTTQNVIGTVQFWMLPFVEQDNVQKLQCTGPPPNQGIHPDSWWCGYNIKTYWSPGDPTAPANGEPDTGNPRWGTSYAPNEGVFNAGRHINQSDNPGWMADRRDRSTTPGATNPTARIPATFQDGTSNTIVFAEKNMICGPGGSQATLAPAAPRPRSTGARRATTAAAAARTTTRTPASASAAPPRSARRPGSTGASARTT